MDVETIEKISAQDKPTIDAFLLTAYFPDSAELKAMRITEVHPYQRQHLLAIIDEGFSYAAKSKDGTILGMLLMGEVNNNDSNTRIEKMQKCTSEYFLKLLKYHQTMEKDAKLLQVCRCDKGLEFKIVAVLPSARQKGISKRLFEFGTEIAKKIGYKLITCHCASEYTSKLCQSLDWSCVYCLPYTYFEQDGERVFENPVHPHLYSRIYVKYL